MIIRRKIAALIMSGVMIALILSCKISSSEDQIIPEVTLESNPHTLTLAPSIAPTILFEPTQTHVVNTPTPFPPVDDWAISLPEEQGVDSRILSDVFDYIVEQHINIHSLLVIRHGFLIMEVYYPPYQRDDRHAIYSCSKSVTSALIGFAFQDGFIHDVDQPVLSFFPEMNIDDPQLNMITVEQLLTMSSGLNWDESMPYRSAVNSYSAMVYDQDPLRNVFDQGMLVEMKGQFNYNSGGSHLLSAIIQKVSGESTLIYAQNKLFAPLDIWNVIWDSDLNDTNLGGSGIRMRPRDMAKFGQLYLDGGKWEEQQIIWQHWITQSTRWHVSAGNDIGYGYQWWIQSPDSFQAKGWGGQIIQVLPEQDTVVVITAGQPNDSWLPHRQIVDEYIRPAIKSDQKLLPNPDAVNRLSEKIMSIEQPESQGVPPLPQKARDIDGKTYLVTGASEVGMNSFSLRFGKKTALMEVDFFGDTVNTEIGLDGLYRITDTSIGRIAMKGYWQDDDTFYITQQNLWSADFYTYEITFFNDDTIKVITTYHIEQYIEESGGVLL